MRTAAALPALLAILAVLPAATACSPPPASMAYLNWEAPDRLAFGYQGHFHLANVTTGAVTTPAGNPPFTAVASPEPGAAAPDGSLRLQLRRGADGPINTCTGQPMRAILGIDLVQADGTVVRGWGGLSDNWAGAAWGNASHGFVWDHAASTLSRVAWASGQATDHPLALPAGHATPPSLYGPPSLFAGDQLVLAGKDGAAIVDPRGPSVRAVASPFPGGFAIADGDEAVFGRWADEASGRPELSLARVRLADGGELWRAAGRGQSYAWTAQGLALVAPWDGEVLRWRDGQALPPIAVGDGSTALVGNGARVAIGMWGDGAERLVVLGPDLEPVFEFGGTSLTATSTPTGDASETTTSSRDASDAADPSHATTGTTGTDPVGTPGVPLAALLAALGLLATLRRRR